MSSEGHDDAAVRVVKRYTNRKLYDTVESRYVTLPQVAELVRQGVAVRIIDNNTKDDLTRVTLAQIVYEEERKHSRAQPLTAFKEMLSASGERLISTLRESPVGALMHRVEPQEAPHEPARGATTAPPEAPSGAATDGAVSEPRESREPGRVQQFMEQSREAIDQWQHTVDDRVKTLWESINPAVQIQALQSEVRRLTRRVEALESERARGQSEEPLAEEDHPRE